MRFVIAADGSADLGDETALHHAYDAPQRAWVRANFVSSADGAAAVDGTASGLGSPADQQVLAILRAHADAVLVGAGTVRAEAYGPLRHSAARVELRREAGLSDAARLAVVTRKAEFDGTEKWIADAPVPPIVLTTSGGVRDVPGAEVVACGDDRVEAAAALDALSERGLVAILCEGGPSLFADVAGSGRLDELCLTLSPTLAGPGATRIVAGTPWDNPRRGSLTQLLEDDGLLFARYTFAAEAG